MPIKKIGKEIYTKIVKKLSTKEVKKMIEVRGEENESENFKPNSKSK